MKRFLILTAIFFTVISGTSAKNRTEQLPLIKFNGDEYTLYYSAKSSETGSYINEYYKANQTYTTWDELLALHHYPNAYSPIEHAKEFKSFLSEMGIKSELNDYDDNSAVLDFVIIDGRRHPIILEFNIFRFVKSPLCGTLGLQYAKRYRLNNALEAEKIKKSLYKSKDRYIKKVNKLEIPLLITENTDKGSIVSDEGVDENYYNDFK